MFSPLTLPWEIHNERKKKKERKKERNRATCVCHFIKIFCFSVLLKQWTFSSSDEYYHSNTHHYNDYYYYYNHYNSCCCDPEYKI